MDEVDDNGWAHIHYAAFRGFVKSIERFVTTNPDQLEFQTHDELHSTPLLLAVMSGNLETTKCFLSLGADHRATNSQNHGCVELACMKNYVDILRHLIAENLDGLNVWRKIINLMLSVSEEESEQASTSLRKLLEGAQPDNDFSKEVHENNLVTAVIRILRSESTENIKLSALACLLQTFHVDKIRAFFMTGGGCVPLIKHLKSEDGELLSLISQCIKLLNSEEDSRANLVQAGVIPALVSVQTRPHHDSPKSLSSVLQALSSTVQDSETNQNTAAKEVGCISCLVELLDKFLHKEFICSVAYFITALCDKNCEIQDALIAAGITTPLCHLLKIKSPEVQAAIVEAITSLSANNTNAQGNILAADSAQPLLQLMKKNRGQKIQERSATSLWVLAGNTSANQKKMASLIGVNMLIEFMQSPSAQLNLLGCNAMTALAIGHVNQKDQIGHQNGIQPLVRLLRTDNEAVVLAAVKTIQALCVGIGYVPHDKNQKFVQICRGVRYLIALMVYADNEVIQAHSAMTLGCLALRNEEIMTEITSNPEFGYVRVLKMFYSDSEEVQRVAGSALAIFTYNNMRRQTEVAAQGGVRFNIINKFLDSSDEKVRCEAAFAMVVLARIIPDEELAVTSAVGIKSLLALLAASTNVEVQSLAGDCIARLAHSRAGLPEAIIAIGVVPMLCRQLESESEDVRGCTAVALYYLSHNPAARRQFLWHARNNPYLMRAFMFYCGTLPVPQKFVLGWEHYKKVGLPPITNTRPQLTAKKAEEVGLERQVTAISLCDSGDHAKHDGSPDSTAT